MALETIGLGGILTFDPRQGVRGMQRAGRAADVFKNKFRGIVDVARSVGHGMNQAGMAMRGLGLAALPASLAFGSIVKEAATFEQQMSAIRAVTQGSAEDMELLQNKAKDLGGSTVFTAQQVGSAMELMARQGFDAIDTIASVGGVLNAAAADGMEMADAARIIGNTLKAMGRPVEEAGRVADVLAVASANSNTNITSLGEAMKFAAPQAKSMNIKLEQLVGVLGAVGDAGLQGTIGGTSFTQALVKFLKPSEKGAALLKKYNIELGRTEEGFTDVVGAFGQVKDALAGMEDPLDRARTVTELFGIRGQKAVNAVMSAIDSDRMDVLIDKLENAKGAAEKMAKLRLDNLIGDFTMLASKANLFKIEFGTKFLEMFRGGVQGATEALDGLVSVFRELNTEQGLTAETADEAGESITAVAQGMNDGIEDAKKAWMEFRTAITETITSLTGKQGPEAIREFTRIATTVFLITAAIAPVALALGGIALFIQFVLVPAFAAIGAIAGAIFTGPVLAAIGIATAGFVLFREEGESVTGTMVRLADTVKKAFGFISENIIDPFVSGFSDAGVSFELIEESAGNLSTIFKEDLGKSLVSMTDLVMALAPELKALGSMFEWVGNLYIGIVDMVASNVMDEFSRQMTSVSDTFQAMADGTAANAEGLRGAMDPILDSMGKAADASSNLATTTVEEFGVIGSTISQVIDFIAPDFERAFSSAGDSSQTFAERFKVNMAESKAEAKGMEFALGDMLASMDNFAAGVMTTVSEVVVTTLESLVTTIQLVAAALGLLAHDMGLDVAEQLLAFSQRDFKGLDTKGEGDKGGLTFDMQKEHVENLPSVLADHVQIAKDSKDDALFDMMADVSDAIKNQKTPTINLKSKVCVDGKTIAKATAKHKQEISDRAGFKATPWQRRTLAEQGAAPVGGV